MSTNLHISQTVLGLLRGEHARGGRARGVCRIGASGWERERGARLGLGDRAWGVRGTPIAGGLKAINSRRYGGIRIGGNRGGIAGS